ncbi:hypothetical protein [Tenacibaculum dicentrarchi]|uniref:hypothetical protein n=1 Tax=Tenacibaculum dicentrarchi TaxID=669041 RepID=UPI0035167E9F
MTKKIFLLALVFLTISCGTQKTITEKDLHSSYDKFSKFIWYKNKNDSIVFNEKNLDIVTLKKGKYYRKLGRYTSYLIDNDSILKRPLTFSEKSKVVAYLVYYLSTIDDFSLINSIIYEDYENDLKYYNEFEKNNYYNLPNFKKKYREKLKELKPTKKSEIIPAIPMKVKPSN